MADEGFKRKLAAILSADVVGYSLLMDNDEEATVRTLKSYRAAINDLVQQYRGRIVDSPGDNILAEFNSVVDAVNCAVEIQREFAERNANLAYNRRMEFRIGVNLGDVIEDDGNIYGDGVNIAARVESLAEAGGICLSGRAHDQVENKLGLEYEDLGKHEVKNISKPIQVYRVLSYPGAAAHRVVKAKESLRRRWRNFAISAAVAILFIGGLAYWQFYMRSPDVEPASVEKMAFALPDKPSIAVLPFKNLSGDPKQDYFSDGLTDQISNTLSRFRNLFVISSSSTSVYKEKSTKIQKVAEDLGVKYVLEGSVQRSADRIRITAQLIDATTGYQIWSQRYDREQKDIFAIQDDITLEITKALRIDIMSGEQARNWQKNSTRNLEAWEKYLQADEYLLRSTKEDNAIARRLFEEVIVLDPEYADAYNLLGWTYWWDARFGWSDSRAESIKMAYKYAQKALELNDTLDSAHLVIGGVYFLQGQHEKAIAKTEKAIALNPNGSGNYIGMAAQVGSLGRWDESVQLAKKAIRLHPFAPAFYFHYLGRAYFMTGQLDESITTFKKALDVSPNFFAAHAFLAACYSSLDRHAEAAAAADEVLRINPKFNLESYAKTLPYKNKADIDRYIAELRKAGLPENPPLPLPEKPSIAVLAFDNLSGDPEQEYFSDGIAENIITALSKIGELFVIARNSSFTYKSKPVKVQQVGRELGIRYVLEGSVQKSGDRVRITAQLIDAKNGQHLWADKYDRDLKDIFEIQDEITLKIVNGLQIQLTEGEHARIWSKHNCSLDAYLKATEAQSIRHKGTKEAYIRYGQIGQEIVEAEPECLMGYSILAWYNTAIAPFSKSPKEFYQKAFKYALKGLSIDDSDPSILRNAGLVYLVKREHDKAIEMAQRAVNTAPNGAEFHAMLGYIYSFAGMPDKGIVHANQAIRLDPFPQIWPYATLGRCHLFKGQYDKSLEAYRKALKISPDNTTALGGIVAAYSMLGREEEAHREAKRLLELVPGLNLSLLDFLPLKNQEDRNLFINAWLKAGIPDKRKTAQQNEDN